MSIFSRRNNSNSKPNYSRSGGDDRNRGNRNSRDRQMYTVTCDECGKTCQVPFKPTGDKPVYCSECFEKKGNGNSNRSERNSRRDQRGSYNRNNRNRSRSNDKEMFPAICDACGKECMVPFRPSNDKPIYCSECFEERGNGRDDNRRDRRDNRSSNRNSYRENRTGSDNSEQLQDISNKLEKIIELLDTRKVIRVKSDSSSYTKVEDKKLVDDSTDSAKEINPESLLED